MKTFRKVKKNNILSIHNPTGCIKYLAYKLLPAETFAHFRDFSQIRESLCREIFQIGSTAKVNVREKEVKFEKNQNFHDQENCKFCFEHYFCNNKTSK